MRNYVKTDTMQVVTPLGLRLRGIDPDDADKLHDLGYAPVRYDYMEYDMLRERQVPVPDLIWDENTMEYVQTFTVEALPREEIADNELRHTDMLFARLRESRRLRLEATDYLLMPDYPLDREKMEKVREYRQALRDLPAQQGAPWDGGGECTPWPAKPEI